MSDPKIVASSQVRPYCLVLKYYVRESIKCSRALGSTRQYRSTRSYFPVRPERLRGFLDHRNVSERRRDSVDDLPGVQVIHVSRRRRQAGMPELRSVEAAFHL